MSCLQMASPRPVDFSLPVGSLLRRWYFPNTRLRSSGLRPGPLSETCSRTWFSLFWVRTVTKLPGKPNLMALLMKLRMTWSMREWSRGISGSSWSGSNCISHSFFRAWLA